MKSVYNRIVTILLILNVLYFIFISVMQRHILTKQINISGYYEQYFAIKNIEGYDSMAHLNVLFDANDNFHSSLLKIIDPRYGDVEFFISGELKNSANKVIMTNDSFSLNEIDRIETRKMLLNSASFSYMRDLSKFIEGDYILHSAKKFEPVQMTDDVLCLYNNDKITLRCIKKKVIITGPLKNTLSYPP